MYDYKLCSRGQHSNGCLKVSGSLHLTPVSSLLTVDKCGVIFLSHNDRLTLPVRLPTQADWRQEVTNDGCQIK